VLSVSNFTGRSAAIAPHHFWAYYAGMNKLLSQAIAVAETFPEDVQEKVARSIMEEAKRLSILKGIADADAGRLVPHEDMKAWAKSLGSDNELPMPTCK